MQYSICIFNMCIYTIYIYMFFFLFIDIWIYSIVCTHIKDVPICFIFITYWILPNPHFYPWFTNNMLSPDLFVPVLMSFPGHLTTWVKMHSFWEHQENEPRWPFSLQWEGTYWNFLVTADGLLHCVLQASQDPGICESCATLAEWLTFVLESLKFVFLQLAVKIVFW